MLVFDNRGMGDSDKPWSRYSTSEMARDAIELCNHVGWGPQSQMHVVGSSMGGMIAQEMVSCKKRCGNAPADPIGHPGA